jgi:hypothetical protein
MLFLATSGMPRDSTSFGIVHTFPFNDIITANKIAFVENCQDKFTIDEAIQCLNYIDNILRPRRNRYVHDMWNYDEDSEQTERFDYSVRIQKSQSRKPLSVSFLKIHPVEKDELWATVREVRTYTGHLHALQLCFHDVEDAREKLRKSPPQRLFLPSQPGKLGP